MFSNKKKVLFFLTNIFISFILLFIAYKNIEIDKTIYLLEELNNIYFVIGIFFVLFQILIFAYRWKIILKTIRGLDYFYLLKESYIISFLNQILPSYLGGDLYKVYISNKIKKSLSLSFSLILFEKYLVLINLIILIFFSTFLLSKINMTEWFIVFYKFLLIVTTFLILGILILFKFHNFNVKNKIIKKIQDFIFKFILLFRDISLCFKVSFITILGHINLFLAFYFIGMSLNIYLSIFEYSFIFFIIFFATQVPISIGGWGIRETVSISIFGLFQVSNEKAFAVSTLFGVTLLIVHLPSIFVIIFHNQKIKFLKKKQDELSA